MRKALMLCVVLSAGTAFAQDDAAKPAGGGAGEGNVRYSKTTSIDFEDDTIEGDLTKPDGEYIEARDKVKHSNLIRIREDFEDKVMQSVGEL
ncbi:adventurous gliding motility protein CglF [Myxococcus sp. K38C18041901]|uniref:adventurous gliding motility protein CglF n=1 Tax=Myxococcus guangdongensis TaxID=2906760 RepID=UPI0020A6E224|nr:adventurous gliding motility protein CglF [Myxococcus guangdongensis]MCP3057304.1 adventurous gliding motility protein CglF [Myxococcus guangdongensis]